MKDLVYKVESQHQPRKFQLYMEKLQKLNEKCVHFFEKVEKEKWTQAYDKGFRYGCMTTNIVESINGVFKGAHILPIIALVQFTL